MVLLILIVLLLLILLLLTVVVPRHCCTSLAALYRVYNHVGGVTALGDERRAYCFQRRQR